MRSFATMLRVGMLRVLVVVVCLLAAGAGAADARPQPVPVKAFEGLVDVGGHRLFLPLHR